VWRGVKSIVQLLLKANADANASWEDCGTPLQIAAYNGYELIVKQLLESKADVSIDCEVKWDDIEVFHSERGIQCKPLANCVK
jgi:ankyrin repeat protein